MARGIHLIIDYHSLGGILELKTDGRDGVIQLHTKVGDGHGHVSEQTMDLSINDLPLIIEGLKVFVDHPAP